MSSLKVEERIALAAPVDRVWRFLLDPAAVAGCLPGARLDSIDDDHSFTGTMKVKVGPVTTDFKGKATFTEIVPAEHRVHMVASGDDKGGAGSARMEMSSRIVATADGAELVVVAEVDLAGKLVRFGRGMMEGIGKQLFKQFSERVRAKLAEPEPVAAAPATAPVAAPAAAPAPTPDAPTLAAAGAASTTAQADAPATATAADSPLAERDQEAAGSAPTGSAAPDAVVSSANDASGATGPTGVSDAPGASDAPVPAAVSDAPTAPLASTAPAAAPLPATLVRSSAPIQHEEHAPLDAGNLVWTAFWHWLRDFFARLFGRRS